MTAAIDGFTSPTLKHLRESWWDDEFTEFLAETLRPRPGNRILDVGCGEGLAEVAIGRLHISQIRLVGIDLAVSKVAQARQETRAHNQRVGFAAADACHLPFVDGAFDALYCVAVLQHIGDVAAAVAEFARVTARGGRVVAVEPDNGARYVFSAVDAGRRAFELGQNFFQAAMLARGEHADTTVGPKLPGLFARCGIEPVAVRPFPVSSTFLGTPPSAVWEARRSAIEQALARAGSGDARELGRAYLDAMREYERDARDAGNSFVEIQNTMLFGTVGNRV
jgi:SAM-dependent methyltransferase